MSATPSSIKITALADIGNAISYTTLFPVVSMQGTPTTDKANLQIIGNIILNGAGGSYFPAAAQSLLALSVANAAQPNITSVGTLTALTVLANINAGNTNGGNIVNANFYYGSGQFLTNLNIANVVGLGNIATINLDGNASNLLTGNGTYVAIPSVGNIATINLDGSNSNVLYGNGVFAPVSGGANTGNIGFNNNVIYSLTGVVVNNSDLANGQTAGMSIPAQGDGNAVSLYNTYGNVNLLAGNIGNFQSVQTWSFAADGTTRFPNDTIKLGNGIPIGILTQSGNVYTQINQFPNNWEVYSQEDTPNANSGWAWIRADLPTVDTPIVFIETQKGSDGVSHRWTFDKDGNLTLPGVLIAQASDNGSIVFSNNGTDTNGSLKVDSGFNMIVSANSNFYVKRAGSDRLAITDTNTDLMASSNVVIHANKAGTEQNWTFSTDGNLTLPAGGNLVTTGNLSAGNANVTGDITANNIYATNIVAEASFSIQNSNFNANIGGRYGVNTISGAVTATLPTSPATGGAIFFADAGGAFASNNLTINPNGQTIMGSAGNMTVSTDNQSFGLLFNGATWRTYN